MVNEGNGVRKCLDDFSSERRIKVSADSDWATLEWDFKKLYNYYFISENINRITLKASADQTAVDNENGYEMTFYLDDIDIINR